MGVALTGDTGVGNPLRINSFNLHAPNIGPQKRATEGKGEMTTQLYGTWHKSFQRKRHAAPTDTKRSAIGLDQVLDPAESAAATISDIENDARSELEALQEYRSQD